MFRLYTAESNATNFAVLYDVDNDRSAIIDWDLSESEIEALANRFEAGELTAWDNCAEYDWEKGRNAFNGLFNVQEL